MPEQTNTPATGASDAAGDAVETFLTHLRTIADIKAESRTPNDGRVWGSAEELLLSMVGTPVAVASLTLPDGMRAGQLRACYRNALMASIGNENYRYTEGYACSGFFPVAHAWVTDITTGAIYDPTWINLEYEGPFLYMGLSFSRRFMARMVDETGDPSVFESDYRRRGRTVKNGLVLGADGTVAEWGDPPPF